MGFGLLTVSDEVTFYITAFQMLEEVADGTCGKLTMLEIDDRR